MVVNGKTKALKLHHQGDFQIIISKCRYMMAITMV